jgi:Family of unknown function (DUF6428)
VRSHRDIGGGPAKGFAPPRQPEAGGIGGSATGGQVDALPLVRFTAGRRWRDHEERAAIDGDRSRHDSSPAQIEADLLLNIKKRALMKTSEFIAALRSAPTKKLVFGDASGNEVPGGYHLTELKAARLDTVDCGGQANRWNETIAQLWVPSGEDGEHMTAAKFLRIYDKVSKLVDLDEDAEFRVEYGDEQIFPSIYDVASGVVAGDSLRVALRAPKMTCKARDRRECCQSEQQACCA